MNEVRDVSGKKVRVYIAGPMESAGGNWNIPLFDFVAKKLRALDCEVFSPAEHLRDSFEMLENVLALSKERRKFARNTALKDEINWIIDHAELVLLLPGWEKSPGATAERAIALACGKTVRETGNIILPASGGDIVLDPDLIKLDPPAPAA